MHLSEIITQVLRRAPKGTTRTDVDVNLDLLQRQYIQPIARVEGVSEYTVTPTDEIEKDDIETDIYRINYVINTTDSSNYVLIPLLGPEEVNTTGIRVAGSKVHLQNLTTSDTLEFHYDKQLSPLGGGTGEVDKPEIDENFHDLYWIGGAWLCGNDKLMSLFYDRLKAFEQSRRDEVAQPGFRIRKKW